MLLGFGVADEPPLSLHREMVRYLHVMKIDRFGYYKSTIFKFSVDTFMNTYDMICMVKKNMSFRFVGSILSVKNSVSSTMVISSLLISKVFQNNYHQT